MGCHARRMRSIEDGGTAYLTRLMCSESEGHKEAHYDDTFNQYWRDDEEEPEAPKVSSLVSAWAYLGGL